MFWTKCIILALSLVMFLVARLVYEDKGDFTRVSNAIAVIAAALGIAFCVLMAVTHWNVMIIPKVALYVSACLYVLFKEEFEMCEVFWGAIVVTVVLWIITGIIYITKIEPTNDSDISTTTCNLLCAKDGSLSSGSFSGTIIYVHGAASEKSVYKYYYQQEDGGVKFGTVPAEKTTIYFITADQKPYLETVVTTRYSMNYNNNPATRCLENSSTTYNLYVPEGSITNIYEFDAE